MGAVGPVLVGRSDVSIYTRPVKVFLHRRFDRPRRPSRPREEIHATVDFITPFMQTLDDVTSENMAC